MALKAGDSQSWTAEEDYLGWQLKVYNLQRYPRWGVLLSNTQHEDFDPSFGSLLCCGTICRDLGLRKPLIFSTYSWRCRPNQHPKLHDLGRSCPQLPTPYPFFLRQQHTRAICILLPW
jgi:hypothetical protein